MDIALLNLKAVVAGGLAVAALGGGLAAANATSPAPTPASTPIKHVVVIFDENESFDHYFGTYPRATNPPGEPGFQAVAGTPDVNGLNNTLLESNPNLDNPQRLDRSQAFTCTLDNGYSDEQKALDSGLMDKFVQVLPSSSCTDKGTVMDYYDGNTVTGLWNLAQHFSLNDNSYGTVFGPSTVGALNLISGQTHGTVPASGISGVQNGTLTGDIDSGLDDCGKGTVTMTGKNIGDSLNANNDTWGWFQGGFRPTSTTAGKAACASTHVNLAGATVNDYVAHHEPFMYYPSTANPHHLPPSSPDMIGKTDQANHQYDLQDFDTALAGDNLPAVSFLKPAGFENAHPGSSDPLDEQRWLARTVDAIERSPAWSSTAIVLAYDDSDGWYDHQMGPIVSSSAAAADQLNGPGVCGHVKDPTAYSDRCGYGQRLPMMVISPFAKENFVDNTVTDQTSIMRFIEDNWQLGRIGDQSMDAIAGTIGNMLDFDPNAKPTPKVFLDPTTGQVIDKAPGGVTPAPPETGRDAPLDSPITGSQPTTSTPASTADPAAGATAATPAPTTAPVGDQPSGSELTAGAPPVTGAASSSSGKKAKIALKCTTKRQGKRLSASCVAGGADAAHGRTVLRLRLVSNGKVLATARAALVGKRAKAVLHAKHTLTRGRYTLRISIARADGVTATQSTIRLG
jgi:phospholipase C